MATAAQPAKLSPETIKLLQEQEKWMKDSIEESNKHPGPTFNYAQCRSDAQKWTTDPFDKEDSRNMFGGHLIQVNGQFRTIPLITTHASMSTLLNRAYEMTVCIQTDADLEKQSSTYSLRASLYKEEESSRYLNFILKHNLHEQFVKEDTEENK